MKMKILQVFALTVAYLMVSIPLSSATNVNIYLNGQKQSSVQISPEGIVNRRITTIPDARFIDIKVEVVVEGVSIAHTVEKVYLYSCKRLSPTECIRTAPVENSTYMRARLNWNEVSERQGTGSYPQVANIMTIVKLKTVEGEDLWLGFWDTITRTSNAAFERRSSEISDIDVHARTAELVNPIKLFLEEREMIPFSWITRAVFKTANSLYEIGGSSQELDTKNFQSGFKSSGELTTASREYEIVFPATSSGVNIGMTLNKNPSYTCGSGGYEPNLGESQSNCCYDAGCPAGQYCDVSGGTTGGCKADSITLETLPVTVPEIGSCTSSFSVGVTAIVRNPPSNLGSTARGFLKLGENLHSVTCQRQDASYLCNVTMSPEVKCGEGGYVIGPNSINLTISYTDGPNSVTKQLTSPVGNFQVQYDCGCQSGMYCDALVAQCKKDLSTITVTSAESYIPDYAGGTGHIEVRVKINNPPAGFSVQGSAYRLGNITFGSQSLPGMTGTPPCSGGAETGYEYSCSIPFSIPDYDHTFQYIIKGNSISFDVTYPDGPETATKPLSVAFSDVTIPSYRCGDGLINPEEDQINCCIDAGCSGVATYCDVERGCLSHNDITLKVESVTPAQLLDCQVPHQVNITAKINNMPTDMGFDYFAFSTGNKVNLWAFSCTQPSKVTGRFSCTLSIPPINNCTIPTHVIGGNKLNISVSFDNGTKSSYFYSRVSKDLTASFENIILVPTSHCGDGIPETSLGESPENCCIDVPCAEGTYCDYSDTDPSGACISQEDIRLVVDSPDPSVPVSLDNCEISNDIEVKVHIENQPTGMRVQNIRAILNGENAQIRCQQESLFDVGNYSYACQLLVPRESECSQGQTYDYAGNSISLLIGYRNGVGKYVMETKTADLPDIRTTQSFKTLFNIMEDTSAKINRELDDIRHIIERAQDYAETCVYIQIFGAVATLGLVLAGVFGAYGNLNKAQGAQLGAVIGGTLQSSLGAVCDAMNTLTNVQLRLSNMQIKKIQIDQCIAQYQHTVDSGSCKGQELSCYSQLTSCYNQVSSIISDGTQIRNEINQLSENVNNVNRQIIQTVQQVQLTQGYGSLQVSWDGSSSPTICGYVRAERAYTTRQDSQYTTQYNEPSRLRIMPASVDCRYFTDKTIYVTIDESPVSLQTVNSQLTDNIFGGREGKHTIKLFCGDPRKGGKEVDKLDVYYCKGTLENACEDVTRTDPSNHWQCREAWSGSPVKPSMQQPPPTTQQPPGSQTTQFTECREISSCGECTVSTLGCGWCPSTGQNVGYCVTDGTEAFSCFNQNAVIQDSASCSAQSLTDCSDATTCDSCFDVQADCGWCPRVGTSGQNEGYCIEDGTESISCFNVASYITDKADCSAQLPGGTGTTTGTGTTGTTGTVGTELSRGTVVVSELWSYSLTEEQLDTYLRTKTAGTKLEDMASNFYYRGMDRFDIDPTFAVAVAMHESAYGSSDAARDKNNFFGITNPGGESAGFKEYDYPDQSIEDFYTLMQVYVQRNNLKTPSQISEYYVGGTGEDEEAWARSVIQIRGDVQQTTVASLTVPGGANHQESDHAHTTLELKHDEEVHAGEGHAEHDEHDADASAHVSFASFTTYAQCMESVCVEFYTDLNKVDKASSTFKTTFDGLNLGFCCGDCMEEWNSKSQQDKQTYVNSLGQYCCGQVNGEWHVHGGVGECHT